MIQQSIWEGKGYIRAALVLLLIAGGMTWEYNDRIYQTRFKNAVLAEDKALAQSIQNIDPATQKIATFIEKKTQYPGDPVVLAKKIKTTTRHPKTLAAIMKVESNGRIEARGKVGEKGLFQVRPEIHGPVSHDPEKMVDQSAQILEDLLKETHGNLDRAVQKYNGTGPQAKRYAMKVAKVRSQI